MEEISSNKKDLFTIMFVIFLIILAIIGCCLLFLKPTKIVEKEEQTKEQEIDQTVPDELVNELIQIIGIDESSYLNDALNELQGKDFHEVDDNTILDMFLFSTDPIEEVDGSLCQTGPYVEACVKYLKSDFISFLKNYDFINNFDYLTNTNDEYIYLRTDVAPFNDWIHDYQVTYGYNGDTSTNYITISDTLLPLTEDADYEEKYNYIFKKATDDTKSEYYLIKVERAN